MKRLLILLFLFVVISPVFAILPNTQTDVVLSSSLKSYNVSIESITPAAIYYNLFTDIDDSVYIYLQVASQTVPAGYQYTLSLKDVETGTFVFKDVKTTRGSITSLRIKAHIDGEHPYSFMISCPGNLKKKTWYGATVYLPITKIYLGLQKVGRQYDLAF